MLDPHGELAGGDRRCHLDNSILRLVSMRGVTIVEPKCFIFSTLPGESELNVLQQSRASTSFGAHLCNAIAACYISNNNVAVNKSYNHQVKVKTWRCVAILSIGAAWGVRLVAHSSSSHELLHGIIR
jgi:hypothetical protein